MSNFARMYIKQVADSEYWELYTSWCEILMLQNYLDCMDISSFMHVDNSLWEANVEHDLSLKTLRQNISGLHTMKACTTGQNAINPLYTTPSEPHTRRMDKYVIR